MATVGTTALLGIGPGLLSVALGDVAVEVFIMGSPPAMFARTTLLRLSASVAISVLVCRLLYGIRLTELRACRNEARLAEVPGAHRGR